jgi:hypothetical protein
MTLMALLILALLSVILLTQRDRILLRTSKIKLDVDGKQAQEDGVYLGNGYIFVNIASCKFDGFIIYRGKRDMGTAEPSRFIVFDQVVFAKDKLPQDNMMFKSDLPNPIFGINDVRFRDQCGKQVVVQWR